MVDFTVVHIKIKFCPISNTIDDFFFLDPRPTTELGNLRAKNVRMDFKTETRVMGTILVSYSF